MMPSESRSVLQEAPEAGLGSLRGCLVEGDTEQRARERRVRRRALIISIAVQSAALTALLLVPLLGKTERLVLVNATPVPPYAPYRSAVHETGRRQEPLRQHIATSIFAPPSIPQTISMTVPQPPGGATGDEPTGLLPGMPGTPGTGLIPIIDPRRPTRPDDPPKRSGPPPRLHVTELSPAMLIRRVEPAYPALAKQIHKEGKVELRAIIATDGSIQSLEILSGDPIFYLSAKEAVQQWRYRPTMLNGQSVEIDTHITVIYTMQH